MRVMLRLKVLASVVPLAVAALFARGGLLGGPRPCIEISGTSVQIATLSWQAHRHVSFTSDPGRATVRVQISETAEAADFTVIDDVDTAEAAWATGADAIDHEFFRYGAVRLGIDHCPEVGDRAEGRTGVV